LDNARDGDVVLCMGAGTIGAVAGLAVEMAQALAQKGGQP
jgi:UDP-N-acetylmuramate--alanine ligase